MNFEEKAETYQKIINPQIIDSIHKNKDIKVSIICATYNHLPYIENTLNNLLQQKTNFDYEIIVHDDNSTDGTKEIVERYAKKYPNIIRAIIENDNKYSKDIDYMSLYVYPLLNGKYTAICEGDDYWTDLEKLQKQYDFLIQNKEYFAVAGITRYIDDSGKEILKAKPYTKYCGKELKEDDFLKTISARFEMNTMLFKTEILLYDYHLKAREESKKIGDLLIMMSAYENGKVFVFNEVFLTHIVQTRKDSSNYSSIFSYKQKYEYAIIAVNSIRHYKKQHNMKLFIRRYTALFFGYCLLHFKLKDFFECKKKLIPYYNESLVVCLIKAFPEIISYMTKG